MILSFVLILQKYFCIPLFIWQRSYYLPYIYDSRTNIISVFVKHFLWNVPIILRRTLQNYKIISEEMLSCYSKTNSINYIVLISYVLFLMDGSTFQGFKCYHIWMYVLHIWMYVLHIWMYVLPYIIYGCNRLFILLFYYKNDAFSWREG